MDQANRSEMQGNVAALDLIWGASDIAKAIGRTPRATFDMLEKRELPAKKVNGRWVVERSKLVAFFTADPS